jgi:hypothetical protein
MRTLEEMLREIVEILNKTNINYVIVGGIAVSSWGNVRTTRDVDIILLLNEENLKKLVKVLKDSNFLITEEDIRIAIKEKSHFTIFDKLSIYHIDAKGVYGIKESESLRNKRKISLDGLDCWIASPEDTIANKLLFGREQDIKDAEGIYVRQLKRLDMELLEKRCKELGVWGEFLDMKKKVEKYL